MRLCQVNEGCIQLTFQVPSFVQQKVFPLSKEQEKALAAMGVMKLTCGEYQFLVRLSESTCQQIKPSFLMQYKFVGILSR